MSGVISRSFELWCRIVLNTLPSRTNRSSCASCWTRSWSRTGELMCTTTSRFPDLPHRGKKKCQPISICVTHVMSRIKALYRSWAIPCAGQRVYSASYRKQWLEKLSEPGVRRRAEWLYLQLDQLLPLRRQARQALLAESRKHSANRCLQSIPSLGSIRAAILMAVIQTPHRFRTKRQLWAYSGLALETHSSGDYRLVAGQLQRSKKLSNTGGLNANHNHDLKYVFLSAAISSSVCPGPLREFYAGLLAKGARPSMARVTLARKIAAVSLILWKKGEQFDADKLKLQAA